ncbi:lmo0937 family membrane protein [Edaphobacter sp. 12200R-103]|uniref:lmo0937 family membrane protein n=1 Tax=Edaphobacter sp. 12200R-103 TaxID=2703788 RepID=UPI00351B39A0
MNRNLQKLFSLLSILDMNGNLPSLHRTIQQEGRVPCFFVGRRNCEVVTIPFQELPMLWTITIILFILWLVGLVSSYTLGGWIHILLVLAIIVLIFNLLSGRRAL